MEEKNENGGYTYSYTYSATEQEELRRIREKYAPKEEDKMARLRRLDQGVLRKAQTVSLIFGIVGVLILGLGMSFAMSELGEILGSHRDMAMLIGVLIGVVGIAMVSLAYPIYRVILKRERRKIAPEILRLTDELIK